MKYSATALLIMLSTTSHACDDLVTAFEHLKQSDFSLDKKQVVLIDEEKKLETAALLTFAQGEPTYSNVAVIFSDDNIQHEDDSTEPFLVANFSCDDVKRNDDQITQTYVNDEKTYETTYNYRSKDELLIPIKTVKTAEFSAFFMTFKVSDTISYSNFSLLK